MIKNTITTVEPGVFNLQIEAMITGKKDPIVFNFENIEGKDGVISLIKIVSISVIQRNMISIGHALMASGTVDMTAHLTSINIVASASSIKSLNDARGVIDAAFNGLKASDHINDEPVATAVQKEINQLVEFAIKLK